MVSLIENQTHPFNSLARIIVFVPGVLDNVADFAQQIYDQAIAQKRQVFYLTITCQNSDSFASERQLTTLVALTEDNYVHASTVKVNAKDSLDALRQVTHPGDLIIWPEGCSTMPGSLESELGVVQQVLPGLHLSSQHYMLHWIRSLLFWLCTVVILVGFAILEFSMAGQMSPFLHKVLLGGLFLVMMNLIYVADHTFR